jgi:hypothetical protein
MADNARWKDRDSNEWRIALRGVTDELAEGHFRNVPFTVFNKPVENFLDRQHKGRENDTFGPHDAVHKVAHMIVVGGRKREMQSRGSATLDNLGLAVGTRTCRQICFTQCHFYASPALPARTLHHTGNACMPLSDAINLAAKNFSGPWLAGRTRDPV